MEISRPLSLRASLLLAIPLLAFIHVGFGRSDYSLLSQFFAILLGVLAIVLWYIFFAAKRYLARAPIFEVYVSYQYSLYGISLFLKPSSVGWRQAYPHVDSYAAASALAFFATLCALFGFAIVRRPLQLLHPERLLPRISAESLELFALPYLVLSAIVAVLSRLVLLGPTAGLMDFVFAKQINFALQLFLYMRAPTKLARTRLILAVLLSSVSFFFLSNLEELANIAAIALVGSIWLKRRVPWILVIVSAFTFAILQPAKAYYREYAWTGQTKGFLVDEKSSLDAWEYAFDRMSKSNADSASPAESPANRLSELASLAFTVESVPRLVAYQGYESTAEAIVLGGIPRLIWNDKPGNLALGAARFTQILGITTPEQDLWTATAFPLPHHAFLIDGFFGVAVWSFLLGILARFYTSTLSAAHYRFALGLPFSVAFARNITLVTLFSSIWQQVAGWIIFAMLVLAIGRFVRGANLGPLSNRLPQKE